MALVFLSAVCFGTMGIFGVFAFRAGLDIPTVLTYRFALASLVIWPVLGALGHRTLLTGRHLAYAIALGAFGYATMNALFFLGLEFLTAGLAAIVLYTYPAFVVVLAVLTVGERVTRLTVGALALALAGVGLISGADPAGADPVGVAVVVGAALAYALYITAARVVLTRVDPLVLTAHVLPAAAGAVVVYGTATGGVAVPRGTTEWGILVGIATVSTAIPVLAFFAGLERIGASRASIVSTVEPAVTVFLGAALLAEPVTPVTVVGGALILAGVVLLERE